MTSSCLPYFYVPTAWKCISVYVNGATDSHMRCAITLNAWMTSHHRRIRRGEQWRTVQFLACLPHHTVATALLILRNDVILQSANHSHWWIYQTEPACVFICPPCSTYTFLFSAFHCCVFSVFNHMGPHSISSLHLSPGGLSPVLKGFWQTRSRLMCVSLLIDSLH